MHEPHSQLVVLPLAHGCLLALTQAEFRRALKRGKWLRRAEQVQRRAKSRVHDVGTAAAKAGPDRDALERGCAPNA